MAKGQAGVGVLKQQDDHNFETEVKHKGTAVQVANQLLMEMTRTLLEQRLEMNAYIRELVGRMVEKDNAVKQDAELITRFGQGVLPNAGEEASHGSSVEDFLHDIEEDAAEVEL